MRYLITTALEESWPEKRPLLMLGEWCRRYDRRAHVSGLDTQLAPPRGMTAAEKVRDGAEVRRVVEEMLPEIGAALDAHHGGEHSVRYWRIVLGHWLIRYVSVLYNRYTALSGVIATHEIEGTTVLDTDCYSLATADSDGFVWATDDDLWNHVLYARIVEFLAIRGRTIPINRADWIRRSEQGFSRQALPVRSTGQLSSLATRLAAILLPKLARERDAFLLSTYLPASQRARLELSLGQVPQLWRPGPAPGSPPNAMVRKRLPSLARSENEFELLARELWREVIPACFVEGYRTLVTRAGELGWPRRPRFVFTSNAFDTDEQFKVWIAGKVDEGTPYIVGQHGNNYGTHQWWGAEFWPERMTPDRFITWGWRDSDSRNVPAFVFKIAGKKRRDAQSAGGLLLVEVAIPHRISPHDSDAEFAIYQAEQFRFVRALPTEVCNRLTVRLHGEYRMHQWREDQRWADQEPHISIEKGIVPIEALVNASRLVVHSYDSTGILETLAMDIPTMCFWNGGLDHLLPSARPYYELLRGAGILHDTPEAAAVAVASCWADVAGWWWGSPVRRAREAFCDQYARTERTPVRTLRAVLTAVENVQ